MNRLRFVETRNCGVQAATRPLSRVPRTEHAEPIARLTLSVHASGEVGRLP